MLMVAPNGARRGKQDHPGIPITIAETVEVAIACRDAGADALHLHVRDAEGRHSLDTGLYREALAELEAALPGFPVQVTSEAAGRYDVAAQVEMLEALKPAWASVALREAARDLVLARRLYDGCRDHGTQIQHIVYDADDTRLLARWLAEGLIEAAPSVLLVLGRYSAGMTSDPAEVRPMLDSLPPVGAWMLCAFGRAEHACLVEAAALGGSVRVGFENSIERADGSRWPDMAASVSALRAELEASR